jgi:RHS repeat-associated protein
VNTTKGGYPVGWVRAFSLSAVVLAVLFGARISGPGEPASLDRLIFDFQRALAQEPPVSPIPTDTPFVATPTETATASATATSSSTDTATAAGTFTPTPTETATETPPAGTPTPTPTETVTIIPTASATLEAIESVIGPTGGTIASVDGHAVLSFPAGAVDEPVLVRVAQKPREEQPAALPVTDVVSLWDFTANAVDDSAPVTQFSLDLTVTLHYSLDDLFGLNEMGLRYFSYDTATSAWIESPATLVTPGEWAVSLNHFSTQATGVDAKISLPPILDAASVNLNTGSATFSLPLKVAPSVGGLEPNLVLTYDSARVDETGDGTDATPPSWVGVGWNLSTPHIARSGDRFYLNMAGLGTELVWQSGGSWRGRASLFLEVTSKKDTLNNCDKNLLTTEADCFWEIRDQSGRIYKFGTNADAKRYYKAYGAGADVYYQWDLAEVVDIHGNKATYNYTQQIGFPFFTVDGSEFAYTGAYVISAYPSVISYPGGRVEFNLGSTVASDRFKVDSTTRLQVRGDLQYCGDLNKTVFETQRLASVVAKSWDGSAYAVSNSYTFAVPTIPPNFDTCDASGAKLTQIDVKGKSGGELTSINFDYDGTMVTHSFYKPDGISCVANTSAATTFTNLRLTSVKNGFGGDVAFDYKDTETGTCGTGPAYWGRRMVEGVSRTAGSAWPGSAAITTTYQYGGTGPMYRNDALPPPSPTGTPPANPPTVVPHYVFAGFSEVTERDADANRTKHYFKGPNDNDYALDELTGREWKTERWGSGAGEVDSIDLWQRVVVDYTAMGVPATSGVYFTAPLSQTTTLRDPDGTGSGTGHPSMVTYTYNTTEGPLFGTTDQVKNNETANNDLTDCLITKKTYTHRKDVTAYLILPKKETTHRCAEPTGTPLAESESFYDGAGVGTATPIVGNLTAARAMTDHDGVTAATASDKFIYTFKSYYDNGLVKESSVPIYQSAVMTPPPSGGQTGWVDANKGRVKMEYDPASIETVGTATPVGRFPTKQTVYVYDENNVAATPTTQETTFTHKVDPASTATPLPGYDRVLGLPSKITAPNGMETETRYDEFGRTTSVWRALDGATAPGVEYQYSWGLQATPDGNNYTRVLYRLTANGPPNIDEYHCMDGLGRERQSLAPNGNNMKSLTQQTYNSRGLVSNTRTFEVGVAAGCTPQGELPLGPNNYVEYDPLGGALSVTNSAAGPPLACYPSCVTTENKGTVITSFDQLNHKKEVTLDGWGRTTNSRDYTGTGASAVEYNATGYNYDFLGNLSLVGPGGVGSSNNYTTMTYDALGRKKSMIDPDMSGYSSGTTRIPWTYTYDAAGNLTRQVDARNVTTDLKYDSLNRLKQKLYTVPGGSSVIARTNMSYRYDTYDGTAFYTSDCLSSANTAVGKLTRVTGGGVTTRYCYDARGREIAKKVTVSANDAGCSTWNRNYVTKRSYDAADRLTSVTYPDLEVLNYTYEDTAVGGGKLKSVASSIHGAYVNSIGYGIAGVASVAMETGTNDNTTTYEYDDRHRLSRIATGYAGSVAQDTTYAWQENGNVDGITDAVTSEAIDYVYDDLDRITAMLVNGVSKASYAYDPNTLYGGKIGNMTAKTEGTLTYNFTYTAEHIHAPKTHGGFTNYYDKNGNSSSVANEPHYYDVENRLSQINIWTWTATTVDYLYDGSGEMVRRSTKAYLYPGQYDEKEVFVDGIYQEHSTNCAAAVSYTKYYMALGRVIASRAGTMGTPGTLKFYAADHLGSTVATMSATNGAILSQQQYYPFGSARTGTPPERGYTGQQQETGMSSLGLYYYHARFYSPLLGHFVSGDRLAFFGKVARTAYNYADANPLTRVDTTGLVPSEPASSDLRCDVCDALTAMDALGIHSEEQWNLLLLAVATMLLPVDLQTPEFWDFIASCDSPGACLADALGNAVSAYSLHDLIADLTSVTDLRTLFDPNASFEAKALAVVLLVSPIPGDRMALKAFRAGRWLSHFEEHGAKLGHDTAVKYLLGANRVINSKTAVTVIRKNGDTLYYEEATNEFVVVAKDSGFLRTYFAPNEGKAYFLEQAAR